MQRSLFEDVEPSNDSTLNLVNSIELDDVLMCADSCSQIPASLKLERAQTFPGPMRRHKKANPIFPKCGLAARPLPSNGINLRLSVHLKRPIGAGHSGTVYPVSLITPQNESDLASTLPELCVKIAPLKHTRTLAREGWMYEQLDSDGLCGVAAPRCYGFFKANVTGFTVIPWEDRHQDHNFVNDEKWDPQDLKSVYTLIDDSTECVVEDDVGSWSNSPWIKWIPSRESPELGVLLMERLGPALGPMTAYENKRVLTDVKQVAQDVAYSAFRHIDMRYNNFVRIPDYIGPQRASEFCHRHQCWHRYRLLDYERCKRFDGAPRVAEFLARQIEVDINDGQGGIFLGEICL
ncbi:hypothetical protein AX16_010871 [Volvariella volvacea WC 439]|nr:hypothetical protein AX16_010871 [Volvariella volvacea WC 439]